MKKLATALATAFLICLTAFGQNSKKTLDFTVYDSWKSLSSRMVSDDGNWLTWSVNPLVGDGQLFVRNWEDGADRRIFPRGSQPVFSPNSDYLAFRIDPQADTVRKDKIEKVKSDKMPKDTLAIYLLKEDRLVTYPDLKSFRIAGEESSWLAFQQEAAKVEDKAEKKDTLAHGKKGDKAGKKPEFKGLPLVVINPVNHDSLNFPLVTEYNFSKHGKWLYMVGIREDSVKNSTITVLDTRTGEPRVVWEQEGVVKNLVCDEEATELAFLFSTDTARSRNYSLYIWSDKDKQPRKIVDSLTPGMPQGMGVSGEGRITFSPDGRKLFFGTARTVKPESKEKDTLLADDKVSVDIWNWKDDRLQSVQLKQVNRDREKSWQAVYLVRKNKMVQMGDSLFIDRYSLLQEGDGDRALGFFDIPYRLSNSIASEDKKDVYLLDVTTGDKERLFTGINVSPRLSPAGKYLYWWDPADTSWYSYNLKDRRKVNLTHGFPVSFAENVHDTPDDIGSNGLMGWTADDGEIFLYDSHDIWKIDPDGKREPVCLTAGYGRKNDLRIRYQSLDPEEKFLDPSKDYLFSLMNLKNKKSGFARFRIDNPDIRVLLLDDCAYGRAAKAKNADKLIWTRSTVSEYPDFWAGDLDFGGGRKISHTNPQQQEYNWATVELVEWPDLNGEMHQGLFYKPENLDPKKKYPMIVYFYERHSDGLYTHYTPRPSASIINPVECASNGYLVFMPDVHFLIGLPGKSFYNAIMSGIEVLGQRSYVDMDHLGIQGQSWGGYGTAYMITQTNIFKAASPGAPVSNMTSAYGGIREASGLVRQFQYEKTQSRIGGTLWQKRDLYIENSPLFFADRIETPCLIRHDDGDGAVPYNEGVQLFVALRRLGKPAWLINYNGAPHNLSRLADKKDWSVRMMQFFDHYLKGAPAPGWLTDGVPAVEKKSNETWYRQFTVK